jgi:DNA-binding transcriptional regulator GbsR (MarR family)
MSDVEAQFVENWASLAQIFGMDARLGRVHAVVYLSVEPIRCAEVADRLKIDPVECQNHLDELCALEVISKDKEGYEAEQDPWNWFMATIRQRVKREFAPILESMYRVEALARDTGQDAIIDRISRFTRFVEQLSALLQKFGSVGASRFGGVMRAATRWISRS